MNTIDITTIERLVREASQIFMDRKASQDIHVKGVADYVTRVDYEVQAFLKERLGALYPSVGFLGEEQQNQELPASGLTWVLDPVDGTTNLIHDYHASVISLALVRDQQTVMGIIYDPYLDEMFTAEAGEGAFVNGERMHVSSATELADCLVIIGTAPHRKELAERNFALFRDIFMDAQDVRSNGSAALSLAYVACGRAEMYLECSLRLWDYAAGYLLIQEAGGTVLDYAGRSFRLIDGSGILAGNAEIPGVVYARYLS